MSHIIIVELQSRFEKTYLVLTFWKTKLLMEV